MGETDNPDRLGGLLLPYAAVISATLLLMVVSFPVGLYLVYFAHLSNSGVTASSPVYSLQFSIALTSFLVPVTSTLGQLFFSAWLLFAVMFAAATLQRPSFLAAIRKGGGTRVGELLENPMIGTIVVLGLILLATMIIDSVQTSVGIPTGGIKGDPLSLFVSLTLAPLLEETSFRFFLIGVPVFILLLLARMPARRKVAALLRPSAAWSQSASDPYQSIGVNSAKLFAYFLLVLSAVVFGLAHYLSGAGWEVGKVSEAAVGGLGLGYLYIRYGLHSSMLGHWGVNYFSTVFAFLGQAAWGVPWDTSANNIFNTLPVFLTSVLVGVPAAGYFGYRLFKNWAVGRGGATPDSAESSFLSK